VKTYVIITYRSVRESVERHEARLRQKSLSNQSAFCWLMW